MSSTVNKQRVINQIRKLAPSLRDHPVVEAGLFARVMNRSATYSPGGPSDVTEEGFAAALAEMAPEILNLEAQFKAAK